MAKTFWSSGERLRLKKSVQNRLALAVAFSPCTLKMAISFFLVCSISDLSAFPNYGEAIVMI